MKDKIEVSVILPCYNGESTLIRCLRSINEQNCKLELVFVNDGSKDDSLILFNNFKFNENISVRLINRENKGFVASLDEAINLSKGKYIARIDADDFWDKNHIKKILSKFKENFDYVLIGSQSFVIDDKDTIIGQSNLPINHKKIVKYFHKDNPFVHSSVVFKKEIFLKIGGYLMNDSNTNAVFVDYNLWFEFSKYGLCENLNEKTVYYRFLETSMSRTINIISNLKLRLSIMRDVNTYYKNHKLYYFFQKLKVLLKILIYKIFY